MLNDRAETSVEGIKAESDLLDYFCHYEQDYYLRLAKELTIKSINANQAMSDDELMQLNNQAREARRVAEQLDPGRNRRNNYQGLYKLWQ